ncbi:HNH endonuclease signature motif containing protein [Promicromonospora sp. MEB111]|uniref:HNH endonuclease n=1 Tax=Promicromonospora sp. MEB111 TaxID=3040301 RepID=UPI002550CE5C|nr:HNH endonuclease signature motif containing protein [Promicromonospora sp. MEB111]
MILPGATDTGPGVLVSGAVQAEWVDLLGELEAVKDTVTATQARLAVALDEATRTEEARQSIRSERRGRGVPNQVGAALRVSPHAGAGFVSTSRVWVTQMPHTFNALQAGVLSPWRATLLVRETSHLSLEHRALIDEEICGPAHLAELARMGTRRLVARIKELAARLDVHACVNRNARAVTERRLSIRPAPDLMVYLTALVPMAQGVQAYAQLKTHAETAKAGGDERGVGQIMADTLIERTTGRDPGHAGDVPVTINLLVSDETLLANGDQPGVVLEGTPAGVGTVPAPIARNLAAHAIETDTAWLRSIYVNPHGRLVATTSTSRFHPQGLASLLRAREQGICASPWCDAPVRHLDHVTPHAEGGPTSLDNGQGLCARCNHAKQASGWRQKTTQLDGRHAVETITPTGHTYVSVAPAPPTPARTSGTAPARNVPRVHDAASVLGKASVLDEAPVLGDARVGDTDPGRSSAAPGDVSVTDKTDGAQGSLSHRDRTTTPAWTPAVGMTGPAPGHTPRSRYQIGCHTTATHGTIAYRPSPPPRQPRPAHGPPGRAVARSRRPDLSWTHPT